MDSICPLDTQLSHKISALLKPPSPHQVQEYFDQLVKTRKCTGIKIKQDEEYGKGVYAETDFDEEKLVIKDQMLVGAQHISNKIDCLVCSYCFCFIGSVELQIGRKLYLQGLGLASRMDCAMESSDEEKDNTGQCSSSDQNEKVPLLPKEVIESLMNGDVELPYSNKFSLPSAISCPGGCREAYYCSKVCADADWELFHSLLCTGKSSQTPCKEALLNFIQHAGGSNDIFYLAAKAISFTILRYRKLKEAHFQDKNKYSEPNGNVDFSFALLLEAWRPISMGYKKRWWDCIALPDDVDCCDEAIFRGQIRELAFESLELLKDAIFDEECAALFSLEIYGHIIGMFELNNLDLVVASPVEDYFLYIEDLQDQEKERAETITRPFLAALGDEYSTCCQGSAFFPFQSCMNHSCDPNAKAFKREEDRDGQATIIALRPIWKEEEITISYIDEDLPFKERQALLADYGFKCRCSKCLEEQQ